MVLVIEYVGETICDEPLSESDRDQIRTAFAEIHAFGIMHGDMHTQNIVVGQSNGQRRFWVIDFGMAKATSDTRETGCSRSTRRRSKHISLKVWKSQHPSPKLSVDRLNQPIKTVLFYESIVFAE
ncbi:hypothetical protein BGX34_000379 [Mortierella sp. NVP85]|nr:hypothetical protein BGX34_000379 [Mortierella sp. NVP85]